jgi:hypothetical protein
MATNKIKNMICYNLKKCATNMQTKFMNKAMLRIETNNRLIMLKMELILCLIQSQMKTEWTIL